MATVTELEVVEHKINPGNKIQCHDYICRNYYLQRILKPAAQLILGMMESDSGNSFAQSSARETRNFWFGWNVVREEWKAALKNRDNPHGSLEGEYHILLPTPNEMASISNMKVSNVCDAIRQFCSVVWGLDSNNMQTWVGPGDIDNVEVCMQEVEDCMFRYLGTGQGSAASGFDTGLVVPQYAYGTLSPDLDMDSRHKYEPSTGMPRGPVPDSPDTPSPAPRPGSNYTNPSK